MGPDGQKIRESASRSTKAEAISWAEQREAEIIGGAAVVAKRMTFGELLERYAAEVSTTKRGERWERIRIEALVHGRPDAFPALPPDPITSIRLADLDARHFAAWRDRRLRSVSPASVRREWSLLSNACAVAVREWSLLAKNPMLTVKRPKGSAPRTRRPSDNEIERILYCLGYSRDEAPKTKTAMVGAAYRFAIETAMRAGEIAGLEWRDVELERRYLRTRGKTPAATREVPLSSEALEVLDQLAGVRDGESVFGISTASLDALFRKARAKAGVEDLTFHDSRHEAITRLAKVFDVLELARIVGHRDLRMLLVYYNPSAEDLSKKLK
jgi:integrase